MVPRGELIVTAPLVFGRLHVVPIVTSFLAAYPDIDIRLMLADRAVNLLEEHIDLAVRIAELPDSSLVATRVGGIGHVVCASPAYLTARGTPQEPSELGSHDCITFRGLMSPDVWTFTTGKSEAAIDAAIAGTGIVRVLSYQIADAVRSGALSLVLRAFEPAPLPVNLVYASRSQVPLKLRAFLDFAAPRLRARLQGLADAGL